MTVVIIIVVVKPLVMVELLLLLLLKAKCTLFAAHVRRVGTRMGEPFQTEATLNFTFSRKRIY